MAAVKRSLSPRRPFGIRRASDWGAVAMVKDGGEVVVGLRLPRDLVRATDALLPKLRKTEYRLTGRVSRSMALRLAIMKGIEVLQRELP